MRKYLSVEVEHTRHARFLPLDKAGDNRISLTTLADFQKRAEVKIYLINEDKRLLLHVFEVDRLPKKQAGEPRMVLKGKYDGKGTLQLSISVDGQHYSSKSISIRKYIRERVLWPWILLIALILLGTAAWLFIRSCTPAGFTPPERDTNEHTAEADAPGTAAETAESRGDAGAESPDDQPPAATNAGGTAAPTSAAPTSAAEATDKATATESDSEPQSAPATETEIEPQSAPDLSQQVYFGPNSSRLTPEARRELSQFIQELQQYEGVKLRIEGHCALYGTEQGREELSFERARRVAQFLRESEYRFKTDPVIRGMGGDNPVTRQDDRQHLNRRVEIKTIPGDSNT